jgi:MinD superfamily P-loop ATPase
MRIAVASGKGGTGKTVVSTSLAWHLAQAGEKVAYVDADVEEPNGHLFLHPEIAHSRRFSVVVPALRSGRCTGCGDCQTNCAFNAIVSLPDQVMVFAELCHACGVCQLVCREHYLTEISREIGSIDTGRCGARTTLEFRSATLDVGEARATPLIHGLLEELPQEGTVVLDAPPGTSCAAMEAVQRADLVLLVTEPTPFGLHDLAIAADMCRALGRPIVAAINRSDLGDDQVRGYLQNERIPILAEIPFMPDVARAYAHGQIAAEQNTDFDDLIGAIAQRLSEGEFS